MDMKIPDKCPGCGAETDGYDEDSHVHSYACGSCYQYYAFICVNLDVKTPACEEASGKNV